MSQRSSAILIEQGVLDEAAGALVDSAVEHHLRAASTDVGARWKYSPAARCSTPYVGCSTRP